MPNPRRSKAVKAAKAWLCIYDRAIDPIRLHLDMHTSRAEARNHRLNRIDIGAESERLSVIPVLIVPIRPKAGRRKK